MSTIEKLSCMSKSFDGAHRGIADWYPAIEQGIEEALQTDWQRWTTGWYSSKHECASAQITRIDDTLRIEASVTDDFDTYGLGVVSIPVTTDLESIREAIREAHDNAIEDQKKNMQYAMFIVGKAVDGKRANWIETFLLDTDDLPEPPGDNYHHWGWQQESDEIPDEVKKTLEIAAQNFDVPYICQGWVIEEAE